MRAVNLLPREVVEHRRERPQAVVLVAAIGGAAVMLALVAGFLVANRSVKRERAALSTARAVLAVTPAHKAASTKNDAFRQAVLTDREQRSLALASAISKRVSWDRILRRMALVLPDDVWLTNLVGNTPLDPAVNTTTTTTTPSALPAPPTALTLQGYTYSQGAVARLLERLQILPDLKNVQLQDSEVAVVGGQAVISFTIVSDIRNGRGAA
jgi:Tfp pilus assembly protein PilN